MKDNVIETSIDELIRVLRERGKMSISEAADFLKVSHKQLEPWLNILEENGIIEIKYPVIGEPKIIWKPTAPEKIDIKNLEAKPEVEPKIEEKKVEPEIKKVPEEKIKIEKPKISEKIEIKPEIKGEETKVITEKIEKLESRIVELSREVDISMLKEELSEILLITAGLRDIEKISFYLKEVLSLIHKMKEKGIWSDEDKVLVTSMLGTIAENWREYGDNEIAKLFDRIKEKIETA